MIDILKGIRVLDLGRYISGPSCCRILADMGAEVIKVERKQGGDEARVCPPFKGDSSLYFYAFNRNKKSVTINFRSEKGQYVLRRLIEKSDVVVENFRVGTMAKMGLSYEEMKKINPRIILVSISGFGQKGPDANQLAFDRIITARSHLFEHAGDGRFCGPELLSDNLAGIHSAMAAILALYDRERTGEGQWIDSSMLASSVSMLPILLANAAMTGGQESYDVDAPNGYYKTKDGWYATHTGPQLMYQRLSQLLQDPVLLEEKYLDVNNRIQDEALLKERIAAWFADKTTAEVDALFHEGMLAGGPAASLTDVLNDRQLAYRGDFTHLPVKDGETVPYPKFPAKFSAHTEQSDTGAPELGQDNLAVLTELLGMTPEEAEEYIR